MPSCIPISYDRSIDITEGDLICYLSAFVRKYVKKAIETEAVVNLASRLTTDNYANSCKFVWS